MKKSYFTIGVLVVLNAVLFLTAKSLNFDIEWWYYLAVIALSAFLGNFLYVILKGVNISSIIFLATEEEDQEFICNFQLGFSEMKTIYGVFKNELNLSNRDLKVILYNQTTRKDLEPLEVSGAAEKHYQYRNQKFLVKFSN